MFNDSHLNFSKAAEAEESSITQKGEEEEGKAAPPTGEKERAPPNRRRKAGIEQTNEIQLKRKIQTDMKKKWKCISSFTHGLK